MGRKSGFGGLIGAAVLAAGAAVVIKYLKEYTDFRQAAEEDIHEFEGSKGDVKEAAKRTYTSISTKDKEGFKSAAGDLAKAAGGLAADAGSIAVTAGQSAAQHVKEMKAKYDEDPEAAKSEVLGNLKEMASDVGQKISGVSTKVGEKLRPEEVKTTMENVKNTITDTVSDIREEYQKNLDEVEQEAEEKEAELQAKAQEAMEKSAESLREEAKKHEANVTEEM